MKVVHITQITYSLMFYGEGCLELLVAHLFDCTYALCSVIIVLYFCFLGPFPIMLMSALPLDHYAYRR